MTEPMPAGGVAQSDPAFVTEEMRVTDRTMARSRNFLIALVFFGTILNYVDRQVLSLSLIHI